VGQLNVKIPDELEEKFRKLAVEKFGARKGFLTLAIMEAFEEWIKKNSKEK